jgi:hypothetical protein
MNVRLFRYLNFNITANNEENSKLDGGVGNRTAC